MSLVPANTVCHCGEPVEDDGFCAWHGPFSERWQCDDCVHKERGRSQGGLRPPDPSSKEHIHTVLEMIGMNIRNMAMINQITGTDAATADRSIVVSLNFRDSRVIYQMIGDYLYNKYFREDATAPAEQPAA